MNIDIQQLLLHIISLVVLLIPILLFCIIALIIKRNSSQTKPSKPKYTYEAQRACEDVKQKRKQDEKPPWEE